MATGEIRLGTCGWSYADWIGSLYAEATPAARYLAEYAQCFDSVEIDSTFYATPSVSTVAGWHERTPERFVFAAKVPRLVTHERELVDVLGEIEAFAKTMRGLGPKCGPLLLQFPPSFTAARWEELAALLPVLPSGLRWAVEVRHTSWLCDAFYDLLRAQHVALAHVDLPWMPRTAPATADFVYIRWLGDRKEIKSDFSHVRPGWERTADLDWWARQIRRLSEGGIDVYAYANNHYQGHSPGTLRAIQRRLGLPVSEPRVAAQQQALNF